MISWFANMKKTILNRKQKTAIIEMTIEEFNLVDRRLQNLSPNFDKYERMHIEKFRAQMRSSLIELKKQFTEIKY